VDLARINAFTSVSSVGKNWLAVSIIF